MKTPRHLKARPKVIRVMGRNYNVTYLPYEVMDGNLGMCSNSHMKIAICQGQHPIEELDTVIHEIMHALYYLMSLFEGDNVEEEMVRRMATGFTAVLLDNPQLVTYINTITKEAE